MHTRLSPLAPLFVALTLLGCPNNTPPSVEGDTDTDTDSDTDADTDTDTDTDTDIPPGPDDSVALSDLEGADESDLCAELGAIAPVALTCGPADLLFAPDPFDAALCEADLAGVPAACDVTVGELRDCADDIAAATCTSDFADDPCRSLYMPACQPLDLLATRLLGAPFGLQDPLPIVELSPNQDFALCLLLEQPVTTVFCDGQDITIEPAPTAECASQIGIIPASCPATIADAIACNDAAFAGDCDALFGGGPCEVLVSPACTPFAP